MDYQLLLLEDVYRTGRKGDIVRVKPGFARNYLIPQKKGVVADKKALGMREKLIKERAKQAAIDKEESEKLALQINERVFYTKVKVDDLGHLYGSVSAQDILKLLEEEGIHLEKNAVSLPHPIKKLGEYRIVLRLKEGVTASFLLGVLPDRVIEVKPAEPIPVETLPETEISEK